MYSNEHVREMIEKFGLEETLRKLVDTENIIDSRIRVDIESLQRSIDNFLEDIFSRP